MFWATMCPSSGENTVPMRHLVFVTLKQVDSLKLRGLSHKMEGVIYMQLIKFH